MEESSNRLPIVDSDRIEQVYEELRGLEVTLDPNPIDFGPRRFNAKIAKVRSMLNRVEQLFLQTSEDLHLFKRVINAKRGLYELEKRELLVRDPKCRMGRSQGEREAYADVQLRDSIEDLQRLERCVFDLETVLGSIKSRRVDLKDAQARMRDQLKMIEHDLHMGARWGGSSNNFSCVSGEGLDDLLAKVDKQMEQAGVPVAAEDSDAEQPHVEDAETFLRGNSDDFEVESLLDGLADV